MAAGLFSDDLVANPIAQHGAAHSDGRSRRHVLPVVPVARHTVDGHSGGHGISRHDNPGVRVVQFLVENGRPEEGHRRVAGEEGVAVGVVGPPFVYALFQCPCCAGGECAGSDGADQQPLPRAFRLHATGFQCVGGGEGYEAQHIVGAVTVVRLLRENGGGQQGEEQEYGAHGSWV